MSETSNEREITPVAGEWLPGDEPDHGWEPMPLPGMEARHASASDGTADDGHPLAVRFPAPVAGRTLEGQILTLWTRPGRHVETFRTSAGERVRVEFWTSTGRGYRIQGRPDDPA